MALDTFNSYLFVSAGEQSNKFLTPTYADGIAKFQAQRAQELTGLTVRIDPIQEGTGDPSPDNIRPISGRTGMTVTVQSGDTQNIYPITWQTEAGAVYGGTLDVVSGVLTVDRGYKNITLNNFNFNIAINAMIGFSSYGFFTDAKPPVSNNAPFNAIADSATVKSASSINGGANGIGVSTSKDVYLRAQNAASKDDYLALFPTGINVAYELATPQTYQLSPTDVQALAGFNQVYSDAGPVIDIKF